jgi:hypothetical protein
VPTRKHSVCRYFIPLSTSPHPLFNLLVFPQTRRLLQLLPLRRLLRHLPKHALFVPQQICRRVVLDDATGVEDDDVRSANDGEEAVGDGEDEGLGELVANNVLDLLVGLEVDGSGSLWEEERQRPMTRRERRGGKAEERKQERTSSMMMTRLRRRRARARARS